MGSSELERAKTKSTTLNSTIIPRCRKSEAYYVHPAVSARHINLYYATMQYNSFRKRSWCVPVLPLVDGSKIYIYNDHRHGRPAGCVLHPSPRFNAWRTKSLISSTCTLVLTYSPVLYKVGDITYARMTSLGRSIGQLFTGLKAGNKVRNSSQAR